MSRRQAATEVVPVTASLGCIIPKMQRRRSTGWCDIHESSYARTLHPGTFLQPRKGCMTVSTLEDSLSACSSSHDADVHSNNAVDVISCSRRRNTMPALTSFHDGGKLGRRGCVTFRDIEVREYERQLGDNPSVSAGPPLTIGWTVRLTRRYSLDDFEEERASSRRNSADLLISPMDRFDMLKDAGHSPDEIGMAIQKAISNKLSRQRSKRSGPENKASKKKVGGSLAVLQLKVKKVVGIKSTDQRLQEEARNRTAYAQSSGLHTICLE